MRTSLILFNTVKLRKNMKCHLWKEPSRWFFFFFFKLTYATCPMKNKIRAWAMTNTLFNLHARLLFCVIKKDPLTDDEMKLSAAVVATLRQVVEGYQALGDMLSAVVILEKVSLLEVKLKSMILFTWDRVRIVVTIRKSLETSLECKTIHFKKHYLLNFPIFMSQY